MSVTADIALRVTGLHTRIDAAAGVVRPLDGVDLEIRKGETFAIVGESGCGKSMTALSIMRLLPEAAWISAGSVMLDQHNVLTLPESSMRDVRGARMGMIFQEPATSLNPVLTCGQQIVEVLERHNIARGAAAQARALEWMQRVGIPDPARRLTEYPFQLSGGMKQRVMIALALSAEPEVLIADEPTTALDVTIQAQILDLLNQLQRERGMAILLITHDLGVVARMAHRVALMYAGEIIEIGTREAFFSNPQHPYAKKLFNSLPGAGKRGAKLDTIAGFVPPLHVEFTGCRFADRCDAVHARCRSEAPVWRETQSGHQARCHLLDAPTAAHLIGSDPTYSTLARVDAAVPERSAKKGMVERAMALNGNPVTRADPLKLKQASAQEPLPERASDDGPAKTLGTQGFLAIKDLKVHFPIRKGLLKRTVGQVLAVDGVSFEIAPGRTLALVGESGCGKTTVGKGLLQLIRVTGGSIRFEGQELTALKGEALRRTRAATQIVFQDPFASLNPRMRVGDIIAEGMGSFNIGKAGAERDARVLELLEQVGLAGDSRFKYPHEFSGGQRQRIAIARALAVNPKLIVCDEPTSALDVSVQAQILNLLKDLQQRLGVSYLFITHNIGVVEYLAHDVAVMYLGRIVEAGTAQEVLNSPRHPYSQALLSAVPRITADADGVGATVSAMAQIKVGGELPSPANPPQGCHFHPRCPQAQDACRAAYPAETAVSATHRVRCVLVK